MHSAAVLGVGVAAAGMPNWDTARAILRGERCYQPDPFKPVRTALLPRNEARRAGTSVRLAFQAAEQACAGYDPSQRATVFASSAADTDIADKICANLADPNGAVSPTQFHNSVHNTPAGYWSIATGSREPASSLSGGRDTFAAGLLETWATLAHDGEAVLFVTFEAGGGGLIATRRPDIVDSFAVALLLAPGGDQRPTLEAMEPTQAPATTLDDALLERYRHHNPAARSLSLLAALATSDHERVVVESGQGNIAVSARGCA